MLTGKELKAAVVLAAGFEYILVGYDQGLVGGIITGGPFNKQFNYPSTTMQGLIASLYDIGSFFGSGFIAFTIGEKLGRRKMIIYGELIMLIGTILQGTSFGRVQLCIGRFISGLGNGMNSGTIPTWQAELTSHKSRGRAVTVETAILIFGIALAYWIGFGTNHSNSSLQWRLPIFIQSIFIISVLISMFFLPESPRWLVKVERDDEAQEVLQQLEGTDSKENSVVMARYKEIKESYLAELALGDNSIRNLFKKNDKQQNLRRLLLGAMPLMMNQISGINAAGYYMPTLLQQSVGLDQTLSLILAGVCGTQWCIASALPAFFIDSWGRRKTIMFGCAGDSICLIIISITVYINTRASGIATTIFLFLFTDFMGMSILPVSWCYAPEISSLQYRSKTNAIGMAVHWIFNFMVVMITPVGVENLGYRFYIIWAVTNASFVFMNYFFMVETAGRTLEEMDLIFEKHQGVFALSKEEKSVGSLVRDDEERKEVDENGRTQIEEEEVIDEK